MHLKEYRPQLYLHFLAFCGNGILNRGQIFILQSVCVTGSTGDQFAADGKLKREFSENGRKKNPAEETPVQGNCSSLKEG